MNLPGGRATAARAAAPPRLRPPGTIPEPLLQVRDLTVDYLTRAGMVRAVDGATFDLPARGSIAILGESGSGKSTLALALTGLLSRTVAVVGGTVALEGSDLISLPPAAMEEVRGQRVSMIFQDPLSSLNPVKRIGDQVAELFTRHRQYTQRRARSSAIDVLKRVQIPNAAQRADDYPHQFSGGMRQRVMIAIALALEPQLVIADEPTTALDVTIQAQIIDLLGQLQEEVGTALIVITHDLGIAAALASRLAVIVRGPVRGDRRPGGRVPQRVPPIHAGAPRLHSAGGIPPALPDPGVPPSIQALPGGCRFHPRCTFAEAICQASDPSLHEVTRGRLAACHFAERFVAGPVTQIAGGS